MLQGLLVVVGGMGIVFLSLIIIILVIMGLDRLFRAKEPAVSEAGHIAEVAVEEKMAELAPAVEAGIVAAISVAVARLAEEGLLVAPKGATREVIAGLAAALATLPGSVVAAQREGAAARRVEPDRATVAAVSGALTQMQPGIGVTRGQLAGPRSTGYASRSRAWRDFGRQQLMSRAREKRRW